MNQYERNDREIVDVKKYLIFYEKRTDLLHKCSKTKAIMSVQEIREKNFRADSRSK